MSEKELASELEKLRLELQSIKASQHKSVDSEVVGETMVDAPPETTNGERETSISTEENTFDKQLEELTLLLEKEIKELPTVTCLAVFSLGILLGRLLR